MNFDKMMETGIHPSTSDYENLIRALANSKGQNEEEIRNCIDNACSYRVR
jgi:hypothetical protein